MSIELREVTKSYGWWKPRPALRGVSLSIEAGTCFGLAGPNGAGKTTLIRTILGLTGVDSGEVRVFGRPPREPSQRARVGFVPEGCQLSPGATPRELAVRFARLRNARADAVPKTLERFERLGLSSLIDRTVGRFSKGEAQRVLLSLAMLGEPELLVLDEPTDGLDPIGRELVREVLRGACARGTTVFLNSHLLHETERLCTRVAVLHQGVLVRDGAVGVDAAFDQSVVLLEGEPSDELVASVGARRLDAKSPVARGLTPGRAGVALELPHRDAGDLNARVDQLRAGGARLLELTPRRVDLEATFAQAVTSATATPISSAPTTPLAPVTPAPVDPLRPVRAAGRVMRETLAELASQKVGWVLVVAAVVGLVAVWQVMHSPLFTSGGHTLRSYLATLNDAQLLSLARQAGDITGMALYWSALGLLTLVSAMFAVPLLDPRRTILLYAQPLTRADYVLGLFSSAAGAVGVGATLYALALFGLLRWLGLPVSARLIAAALPLTLAFSSVYLVVLSATLVRRSAFSAGLAGLTVLGLLMGLGFSDVVAPDAEPSVFLAVYAVAPKLVELSRAAGALAEGAHVSMAAFVSTGLVVVAQLVFACWLAEKVES
ncbi:MAG: ABC transporter ATP-binding protein [Myxococcaceae bacterium]